MSNTGRAFSNVDAAADPEALGRFLDQAAQNLRDVKEASFAAMSLRAGDSVLDVGCGPATDLEALEAIVGPSGRVVGVDSSEKMVAEGQERIRSRNGRAEILLGDAHDLRFAEGTFDAVHTERVLLHIENPLRVIKACVRVLKPGGRLVCVEPDRAAQAVDASDAEMADRVLRALVTQVNPRIGRQLRSLFVEAGLTMVDAHPNPLVATSLGLFSAAFPGGFESALQIAKESGRVDSHEVETLLADLKTRDAESRFFGLALFVTCRGVKL